MIEHIIFSWWKKDSPTLRLAAFIRLAEFFSIPDILPLAPEAKNNYTVLFFSVWTTNRSFQKICVDNSSKEKT